MNAKAKKDDQQDAAVAELQKQKADLESQVEANAKEIDGLKKSLNEQPASDTSELEGKVKQLENDLLKASEDNDGLMKRVEELQAADAAEGAQKDDSMLAMEKQLQATQDELTKVSAERKDLHDKLILRESGNHEMESMQARLAEAQAKLQGYDQVVQQRDLYKERLDKALKVTVSAVETKPLDVKPVWKNNALRLLPTNTRVLIDVNGSKEQGIAEVVGNNQMGSGSTILYTAPGASKPVELVGYQVDLEETPNGDGTNAIRTVLKKIG